MPICEISYPRGFLSEEEKNNVASKLAKILIDAEGLIDNPISRSVCQISINELESVYIGGMPSSSGKILVKIYAFFNAYSEETKSEIYSKTTQLFIDENKETAAQNGRNVWCIIIPIEQSNFGVGGIPVSLEITKKIVSSHANNA